MLSRTFVIKLGGSFLLAGGAPNASLLTGMATTVKSLADKGHRLVIVVGGGVVARQYVEAAAAVGANNGVKDHLGILVSRLNARLFIEALNDEKTVYSEPCETLQQVRASLQLKPIVVLGGLQPGQSTTGVAALCAEYCKAERVIFCTDVDGVYDSDPKKNPAAKRLAEASYEDLRRLTSGSNALPGEYRLMDGMCLTILERSSIAAQIILGTSEAIISAVEGHNVGTILRKL
jgi:uridylate kinase